MTVTRPMPPTPGRCIGSAAALVAAALALGTLAAILAALTTAYRVNPW